MSDEQADEILAGGAARYVDETLLHTAVGTPDRVREFLDRFLRFTNADELITVHPGPAADDRLRSITLLREAAP